nr:prepilin peptidase [Akkermansia muciniphila]
MAIVIMFIDAEHLIVFRFQAFIGALAGTGACALYPFLLPDSHVMTWTDAFTASVLGGAAGYAVIRLVIELGKLLFGTWKQHFDVPAPWSLREPESEREELQLIVNGQPHDWSMLFHRSTDKTVLSGGSVTIDGKTHPACSVTLRYDRIEMENGDVFLLESLESVEGNLTDIHASREAMGSGDAWILMMAGCACGWQGALFSLFLGSLLGIVQAAASRMGFGRNLPFGPALLSAALIWLLGGSQWWQAYIRFISGE